MNDLQKVDLLTDLVILTIAKLQQITGMNDEEVMAKIKEESERSNKLVEEAQKC